MSSVASILGLPPGVHFRPDDDELVELYLLPRARGEPAPFHGVAVVDDDAAGSTLPWKLLDRHGRGADDEAYFFVRSSGTGGDSQARPGARQERGCIGGGTWKSQRRLGRDEPRDAGEKKQVDYWSKHNLNLHMGRGESGGSVGWVMHEYTLTDPSCPPHKICHVTFTGHGKNRKRVPGGDVVNDCQSEPAPKRARVDAASGGWASSGSGWTTTTVDQVSGAVVASADHQEPAQYALAGEDIKERLQGMSSFAASSNAEPCCFEEYVQAGAPTTEQQLPEHAMMMPQPMVQETAGMAELEHMYLCGGNEDQPEFLASLGVSLDELRDVTGIDVAGIGDMDAGGQPAGDNWGGFQ